MGNRLQIHKALFALISLVLLAGCSLQNSDAKLRGEQFKTASDDWTNCAFAHTFAYAKEYKDPRMCADLALIDCSQQRERMVTAQQQYSLSSYESAQIVTDAAQEGLRKRLTLEAKRFMYDERREANAAWPNF